MPIRRKKDRDEFDSINDAERALLKKVAEAQTLDEWDAARKVLRDAMMDRLTKEVPSKDVLDLERLISWRYASITVATAYNAQGRKD